LPDIKLKTDNVEFIDKKILEEQERLEKERLAKLEEEKKVAEAAEWKKFIGVMEAKYNEYILKKQSSPEKMQEQMDSMGFTLSIKETGRRIFSQIGSISKNTLAAKAKLSNKYRLAKIDNVDISQLMQDADEIEKRYYRLEYLIKDAKELSPDKHDYERKKSDIKNSFSEMDLNSDCKLIVDSKTLSRRKSSDNKYCVILSPGTVLLFEITGEYKIWDKETIEITVP